MLVVYKKPVSFISTLSSPGAGFIHINAVITRSRFHSFQHCLHQEPVSFISTLSSPGAGFIHFRTVITGAGFIHFRAVITKSLFHSFQHCLHQEPVLFILMLSSPGAGFIHLRAVITRSRFHSYQGCHHQEPVSFISGRAVITRSRFHSYQGCHYQEPVSFILGLSSPGAGFIHFKAVITRSRFHSFQGYHHQELVSGQACNTPIRSYHRHCKALLHDSLLPLIGRDPPDPHWFPLHWWWRRFWVPGWRPLFSWLLWLVNLIASYVVILSMFLVLIEKKRKRTHTPFYLTASPEELAWLDMAAKLKSGRAWRFGKKHLNVSSNS